MDIYSRVSKERLISLGLSPQETQAYLALLKKGPLSVRTLSDMMRVYPNALYRILEKLKKEHLITLTVNRPKAFAAVSPSIAFTSFVKNRIAELESIKSEILTELPSEPKIDDTRIDLLGGKDDLFRVYVSLAESAKTEILIISLGEAVPEETLLVNRDCIERGVRIRFIVHKYDETNKAILSRWIRMGLEVRHSQGEGFHIVVADENTALLSVSDTKNPENRVALKIHSRNLSRALSEYFEGQWEKARPITT